MSASPQEITLTQAIAAPPSEVYAAFTRDVGWLEWCCEKAEIDARAGGKLHIYTEGYHAYGEFRALEQDRTVEFTWDGDGEPPTLIRVRLDRLAEGTHLTFTVVGTGSQDDWAGIVEFLERVWGHALDNLRAVLEARNRT
jgi:uncharacterized protein YndB with AHSA1/START domain